MNRLRTNPLPVVQLRDALAAPLDALPDAELLERFARYADHPAFEALLRRHGPMVFGVCRRTLGRSADAEDAFQATFLVLIRKARSVRGEGLGPWLYGVAWRVAQKARVRAARLATFRTEVSDMLPDPNAPAAVPDWFPILDAELAALPAKYRDALVLCELQGATRAEAAKALGLREGTLSSRLSRGRELLRKRLLKHGTLLPAGGLAALFSADNIGRATVPAALLTRTSERASNGTVPVGAARLTDEVLKSMFLTKLRITGGALVVLALATLGLGAALPREAPGGDPEQVRAAKAPEKAAAAPLAQPAPKPDEKKATGPKLADRDALQGLWVLEKLSASAALRTNKTELSAFEGTTQYFVAGDVWWEIQSYGNESQRFITPMVATIRPDKHPKWIDLTQWHPDRTDTPMRRIYDLDADGRLTVVCSNENARRPAEFDPNDDETVLYAFRFRREQPPKGAGAAVLLGSWEQSVKTSPIIGSTVALAGNGGASLSLRVEVYEGVIFLNCPTAGNHNWIGGNYTLDTTRNPPGIDITLFNPLSNNLTKLYGSYERSGSGLKLVLGLTGKRAERPTDFAPATGEGAPDRFYFDLNRAALRPGETPETAPPPKAK